MNFVNHKRVSSYSFMDILQMCVESDILFDKGLLNNCFFGETALDYIFSISDLTSIQKGYSHRFSSFNFEKLIDQVKDSLLDITCTDTCPIEGNSFSS